jgi:diguanylate cyclase (GGDEF)-like protein/PAS domain S-box-containing protein
MVRRVGKDSTTDAGPDGDAYRSGLAEELLASAQSVLRLIMRNTPLPELLDDICGRVEALLGEGSACTILLLDPDGKHARVGAAPSLPRAYSDAIAGKLIGPDKGSCGAAMFERRMIVAEDIATDPRWIDLKQLALPIGLRACWSIPLQDEAGGVLGAFGIYFRTPRRPTIEEEAILRDVGRSLGLAIHQDAMAQRLARSEEHLRLVIDHLNEGIIVQSSEGTILACNPSAQRLLQAGESLIGKDMFDVIVRAYREDGAPIAAHERPTRQVLASGKPLLGQTLGMELENGQIIWITENVVPITRPGETGPSSVLVSFTDIGPVRLAEQQLKYLATRDSLTGLYNRTYLADRMRELFEPAHADGSGRVSAAVLFVDLDGFKKVNDSAGHEAGDALLRSVAERLERCVNEGDTLARVGGDEFVIVVSGHGESGYLAALASEILDTIAVPFAVSENEYYLSASIGIALFPEDAADAATLMRNADSAMYYAKQQGRNNFQFFNTELRQQLERRFTVEQSLRRALATGELSLAYQPIIDSITGRTIGAEALLRWQHDELGQVSPTEFIPIAEDTGLVVAIGHWVLKRACEQAAEWRRTIAPDLVIAVNLSPRQFNDGLVEWVEHCLSHAGLDPAGLTLEITEGLLMHDSHATLPMLDALAAMGIRISVDDFGTGYSSLSYLKRFPLHNLKVDRSFVTGLPDHHDSVAITRAVVGMAHSLGMTVTAEGVETRAQAAFLRSIGCEKLQGFLFSRPVNAVAFARDMDSHSTDMTYLNAPI